MGDPITTVVNLLTRLWDVDAGEIRIDGRPIRSLSQRSLRTTVQQIQQDVTLSEESPREKTCSYDL